MRIKILAPIFISFALLGCTRASPHLTMLSSGVSGPLFDGKSSKELTISNLAGSITVEGWCDARVTGWEFSVEGSAWSDLRTARGANIDRVCQNQAFRFSISSTALAFSQAARARKSLRIRGVLPFGYTSDALVNVNYEPVAGNPSRILAGAAELQGSANGQTLHIRGAISSRGQELVLKDQHGNPVLRLSRGQ